MDHGSEVGEYRSQVSEIQNESGRSAVEGGSRWLAVNGVWGLCRPMAFRNGTQVGRENMDRGG